MNRTTIIGVITTFCCLMAIPSFAAELDVTWNPQPGDVIRSSDIRTTIAEIEASVNDVEAEQIADSTITYAELGANSVNSGHIQNVGANTLDSGAINADTMFSVGVIENLTTLIGTASDTTTAFMKMISGVYWGDGTDTRTIWNTRQSDSVHATGAAIPFTVTRVEITCGDGADIAIGQWGLVTDITSDTYMVVQDIAGGGMRITPLTSSSLGWSGNPDYPAIFHSSDSDGFRVRDAGTYGNFNKNGYWYTWTCWGY